MCCGAAECVPLASGPREGQEGRGLSGSLRMSRNQAKNGEEEKQAQRLFFEKAKGPFKHP